MKNLYVIRNTTSGYVFNDENIRHLMFAIENNLSVPCEIVVINSSQQTCEFENIINLDPFSRTPAHHTIDICRNFGDNDVKNGYRSRTNVSLEYQISKIPNGNYYLLDDDIMSGGTINFVKSILPKGINVVGCISLLHYYLSRFYKEYTVVDCIDTHDFWGDLPTSGLNVNGTRYYYQSDMVDIEKRATVNNGEAVKAYLRKHIK